MATEQQLQRPPGKWTDRWTPRSYGRTRSARIPADRGPYARPAAPRHGAHPAVDAFVAVVTLIAAFVITSLAQHQQMGIAEFLTVRISVKNVLLIVVLAYCWVALFRSFGLYDVRRLMTWEEEMLRVVIHALRQQAEAAAPESQEAADKAPASKAKKAVPAKAKKAS